MTKTNAKLPRQPNMSAYNDASLKVRGATTISGKEFVIAEKGGKTAYISHAEFMPGRSAAKSLEAHGLILTGAHFRQLQGEVDRLEAFPQEPLLEQPGWAGGYYALPSGTVMSPPNRPVGTAIFADNSARCGGGGSGPEWRDQVAGMVSDQPLPAFLIMSAFAAPLLRLTNRTDNYGFEVVGGKATGKTTILRLMATTVGAGFDEGLGAYWQTLDTTMAGLETSMQRHQDLPLILDEAGLFMPKEGKKDRASSMVHLAFQLGSGHPRARWEEPQPTQYRFIFVISSNEPATQIMQGNNHAREAAALDRILTLPVPNNGHGVFDSLPPAYGSGAEFSAAIDAAMRQHFGRAFPRFIKMLVDDRAADETRLRAKISTYIRRFRTAVGVDLNDGSQVRVCDAFGLVYAAGCLAKSYEVLPSTYLCKDIARTMYHRHLASRDDRSPIQKLSALAQSDGVLRVPAGGKRGLSRADIEEYDGVIYDGRQERELLLTEAQFRRLFPLIRPTLEGSDLGHVLMRDKDHQKVKRRFNPDLKSIRFFRFSITELCGS